MEWWAGSPAPTIVRGSNICSPRSAKACGPCWNPSSNGEPITPRSSMRSTGFCHVGRLFEIVRPHANCYRRPTNAGRAVRRRPDHDRWRSIFPAMRRFGTLSCRGRGLADIHRQFSVTVAEGFRIDLLELDRSGHDAGLPGRVLGIVLELWHYFFGKQLERFADMFVAVLSGLVEQDHLVDMRRPEAPQFLADGLWRFDQAAAQCR